MKEEGFTQEDIREIYDALLKQKEELHKKIIDINRLIKAYKLVLENRV